jgi:type IV secretion system protein VirD4
MTLHASAAPWQPPASLARRTLALKIVAGLVVAVLLAAYLAGYLLLWSLHLNPREASPLTVARYGYYYSDRVEVRRKLLASSAAGSVMVLASALALALPRRRSLHGDARFATRRELALAGLFGDQGIILGRVGRRCLMLAGQQGVALAAPPRAGKGTGVVIPNLLNWPDSVICVDIKRENWTLTAGFRAANG